MSFWRIAWRNMQQRALASTLTGVSMALGVALMILVLVIHAVVVNQLSNDAQGYHLIVGAGQGSKFEVVLSTVFHVGTPLYPIPYGYYKKFTEGEFKPYVDVAVKRWQSFTGKAATLEGDGRTFAEVEASRA